MAAHNRRLHCHLTRRLWLPLVHGNGAVMTDQKLIFLTFIIAGWLGTFEPRLGFFVLLMGAGVRAWFGLA